MKKLLVWLMGAVVLAQLAVPGWMAFNQEQTLRHGTEFKFQTEPVDPYDCFRGRYVALRFKAAHMNLKETPELPRGTPVYAALKVGGDGFAEVERVSRTPLPGDHVVRARVYYSWRDKNLELTFPFEKFFMDEKLAPQAEKAYREANRPARLPAIHNAAPESQPCWALVRVRHGNAALADLYIGGQPVRDYLKAHPAPTPRPQNSPKTNP